MAGKPKNNVREKKNRVDREEMNLCNNPMLLPDKLVSPNGFTFHPMNHIIIIHMYPILHEYLQN